MRGEAVSLDEQREWERLQAWFAGKLDESSPSSELPPPPKNTKSVRDGKYQYWVAVRRAGYSRSDEYEILEIGSPHQMGDHVWFLAESRDELQGRLAQKSFMGGSGSFTPESLIPGLAQGAAKIDGREHMGPSGAKGVYVERYMLDVERDKSLVERLCHEFELSTPWQAQVMRLFLDNALKGEPVGREDLEGIVKRNGAQVDLADLTAFNKKLFPYGLSVRVEQSARNLESTYRLYVVGPPLYDYY